MSVATAKIFESYRSFASVAKKPSVSSTSSGSLLSGRCVSHAQMPCVCGNTAGPTLKPRAAAAAAGAPTSWFSRKLLPVWKLPTIPSTGSSRVPIARSLSSASGGITSRWCVSSGATIWNGSDRSWPSPLAVPTTHAITTTRATTATAVLVVVVVVLFCFLSLAIISFKTVILQKERKGGETVLPHLHSHTTNDVFFFLGFFSLFSSSSSSSSFFFLSLLFFFP